MMKLINIPKKYCKEDAPMFGRKYRMLPVLVFASLLMVLMVCLGSQNGPVASAAPASQIILAAAQDSYTDINAETSNFDGGLLSAANSLGPWDESDVTTKQIFLEFDLSGVDFEIESAILSLASLTCDGLVPVDAANLTVYGVDNAAAWDETSLTWANQPAVSTEALVMLDAGSTLLGSAQIYTWTDSAQGQFTTWLEAQRNANDKSATLVVVIENSDDPGISDIFFEDSEGTGAAYGCSDALAGPTLEVSHLSSSPTIFLPLINR